VEKQIVRVIAGSPPSRAKAVDKGFDAAANSLDAVLNGLEMNVT